ncbi:MAG: glycoside hydrolase family 5 protein [Chitinophagales bacterium]|nr:glycoside hydrolase family 5 protein [Chitinophagales bacterium]
MLATKNICFILTITLLGLLISCKKEENKAIYEQTNYGVLYAQRGQNPGIYDQQGRRIILRGVNYNVLGDYWQANPTIPTTAQHDENQFKLMSSYGFNCIRLLISWSRIEPQRGQYDSEYISEVQQVIDDATHNNLYVIIDMHQDAYSKFIFSSAEDKCQYPQKGWDGAPQWACLTDEASTCSNTGSRENCDAVVHAWQNLWDNTDNIQTAFIQAWAHLIKKIGNNENVIAYNLINEPSLGYSSLPDQQGKLARFYGNLTSAIRKTEVQNGQTQKMVFFEPAVTFNGEEIPSVAGNNFTKDKNIVFAPHNYFEVISDFLTIEQGFSLYKMLADAYQTTCFIGEWGVYSEPSIGVEKVKRFAKQEDMYKMGSTYWQWVQAPGDPHSISWDGNTYDNTSLHLVELDAKGHYTGQKNEVFLKVLGRAKPIAIVGKSIKLVSDSETGEFSLSAKAEKAGTTEIWMPDLYGNTPKVEGDNISNIRIKKVAGGNILSVDVTNDYSIKISK